MHFLYWSYLDYHRSLCKKNKTVSYSFSINWHSQWVHLLAIKHIRYSFTKGESFHLLHGHLWTTIITLVLWEVLDLPQFFFFYFYWLEEQKEETFQLFNNRPPRLSLGNQVSAYCCTKSLEDFWFNWISIFWKKFIRPGRLWKTKIRYEIYDRGFFKIVRPFMRYYRPTCSIMWSRTSPIACLSRVPRRSTIRN